MSVGLDSRSFFLEMNLMEINGLGLGSGFCKQFFQNFSLFVYKKN